MLDGIFGGDGDSLLYLREGRNWCVFLRADKAYGLHAASQRAREGQMTALGILQEQHRKLIAMFRQMLMLLGA